ncbi:hypothetical protein L9F63_025064, partial [Diploptera punctata]
MNSLVDSIKFLFSAYTENMIEVFKSPRQFIHLDFIPKRRRREDGRAMKIR